MSAPSTVLLCADEISSRFVAGALAGTGGLSGILLERSSGPLRKPLRLSLPHRAFGKLYHLLYYDRARRRAAGREREALFGQEEPRFPEGVPCLEVENANGPEARAFLTRLAPEVMVVWGTRILEAGTFSLASRAVINCHMGRLPDYRGVLSEFWALHDGREDRLGWTIHRVSGTLDGGDVLAEGGIPVGARQDEWDLRTANVWAVTAGLLEILPWLEEVHSRRLEPPLPTPRRGHTPWQHACLHGRRHLWGLLR